MSITTRKPLLLYRIYRYITVICLAVVTSYMCKAEDLTVKADSAYNNLAYSEARDLYLQALDSIGASSKLYYNIGNTYYRLNDLGHAIIWYERALQLDPTNNDARFNLDFVNTRIADKPYDESSLISRAVTKLVNSAHPNTWAWTSLALFALTMVAIVGYLVSRRVVIRKSFFFGGGLLLLFTFLTLCISLSASSKASSHDNAVIIVPASPLSTAPRASNDSSNQAFLLHEGTKVEIVDSVMNNSTAESWYEVKVGGNARAWINAADVERI